jgi:dTDP-4-dehydrorhamnose 3,5-epimerase
VRVDPTPIPGLTVIEPRVFGDPRGFFMETWQAERYAEAGLPRTFVQDNLSRSRRGVLRGLHFQNPKAQGKLVHVLEGEVFDVAVDIRRGSPTFGHWHGEVLSADNHRQLWVPRGMAHGFCVLSETALFAYKCDELYSPETERSLLWSDPGIGIEWPIEAPLVSEKDGAASTLAQIEPQALPEWTGTP